MCQNWDSTSPDCFTSPTRIIRKCKWTRRSFLGCIGVFVDYGASFRFDTWAVSFVFTRLVTLTLTFLVVGFGLARAENCGLDIEAGNFNTVLIRSDRAKN